MENQTHIILDSIADGVFTVDSDWKITSFNRAAEKITGIKIESNYHFQLPLNNSTENIKDIIRKYKDIYFHFNDTIKKIYDDK